MRRRGPAVLAVIAVIAVTGCQAQERVERLFPEFTDSMCVIVPGQGCTFTMGRP